MPQHTGSRVRLNDGWGENLGASNRHYLAGSIAPDLSHACALHPPGAYPSRPVEISEVVNQGRGSNPARQIFEENHPRRAEIFAPPILGSLHRHAPLTLGSSSD
jgi:hypothetical protein